MIHIIGGHRLAHPIFLKKRRNHSEAHNPPASCSRSMDWFFRCWAWFMSWSLVAKRPIICHAPINHHPSNESTVVVVPNQSPSLWEKTSFEDPKRWTPCTHVAISLRPSDPLPLLPSWSWRRREALVRWNGSGKAVGLVGLTSYIRMVSQDGPSLLVMVDNAANHC